MKRKILLLAALLLTNLVMAHVNPGNKKSRTDEEERIQFRNDCVGGLAQRDLAVNNVRARLTTGGDVWWNGNEGRYVVPKVPPGVPEVSAIFAGAVWLGGVDDGDNLKVAAQTFGRQTGAFDFYPGPLNEELDPVVAGTTNKETCSNWDKFFTVTAQEIDQHLRNYQESINNGEPYDITSVPLGVLGWPGKENPFFFDVHGFEMPPAQRGMAGFFDESGDGIYNPVEGDYPIIEIRGCETPQYPDEMVFWVYNDNGNIHEETQGTPIKMEIQVQAFAYATNDQLRACSGI
jgi:hypothetical protein